MSTAARRAALEDTIWRLQQRAFSLLHSGAPDVSPVLLHLALRALRRAEAGLREASARDLAAIELAVDEVEQLLWVVDSGP